MGPRKGSSSVDILNAAVRTLRSSGRRNKNCTVDDVAEVWEGVSELILNSLEDKQKPISISNFGTFTFLSNSLRSGKDGNLFLSMEPNFLSTTGTRSLKSGRPVSKSASRLNYLGLAKLCRIEKDICKKTVEAVIHAIHSAVSISEWIELVFPGLGTFKCKNKKCSFQFELYRENEVNNKLESKLDDFSSESDSEVSVESDSHESQIEEYETASQEEEAPMQKKSYLPPSLERLKEKLKQRGGLNGIHSISRVLKIMDDGGDGKLSRPELKFGLQDYGVKMNSAELDELFEYFDTDHSGSISFDEFLVGLRGPINKRRVDLIGLAFKCLDRNKDGFVTVEDLEMSYDTSKHPEVVSGKKTRAQALREFLNQFDTDKQDGIVTKDEFIGYYKNVSASIDNDDYFELMIRNAWHISGGKGQYENTSNKRVLVTHRDGTQTVEEIKDDLWIDTKDQDQMKANLKQRGIEAQGKLGVTYSNDTTDQKVKFKNKAVVKSSSKTSKRVVRDKKATSNYDAFDGYQNAGDEAIPSPSNEDAVKEKAKRNPMDKLNDAFKKSKGSADEFLYNIGANRVFGDARIEVPKFVRGLTQFDNRISKDEAQAIGKIIDADRSGYIDVTELCGQLKGISAVSRVKTAMKNKYGVNGIASARRVLKQMDTSGDQALDRRELRDGFIAVGLKLNSQEIENLFAYFDKDKNGKISIEEFFAGLCGTLNDRRKKFVDIAFNRMDRDGSGEITIEDIEETYDPSENPDVKSGKKTPREALREFMSLFDNQEQDGIITRDEFTEYYRCLSASIKEDNYFELMMRNAWHISGGKGQSENTTCRRVLVTHKDGSQTVEEIKDDLWVDKDDEKEMKRRLKKSGVSAVGKLGMTYSNDSTTKKGRKPINQTLEKRLRKQESNRNSKTKGSEQTGNGPRAASNAWGATSQSQRSKGRPKRQNNKTRFGFDDYTMGDEAVPDSPCDSLHDFSSKLKTRPSKRSVSNSDSRRRKEPPIIGRMRQKVVSRGGSNGIQTLGRVLRIMDDSGDKCLDRYELKNGLADYGIEAKDEEVNEMFDYLDRDQSGKISFDEFLVGLRGPISQRRTTLIKAAFKKLDRTGDGVVTLEDLEMTYDSSHNPEVKSGKLTKAEGLREFLNQFDTIDNDGIVTEEEFIEYYKNVSASIDADDYFELMMRNAWHMSGGKGQCENTTNKRVLVTNKDGKQTVEEIQDDLWMDPNNTDEMKRRLEKRGIKPVGKLGTSFSSEAKKTSSKANRSTLSLDWEENEEKVRANRLSKEKERRLRTGAATQLQGNFREIRRKREARIARKQIRGQNKLQKELQEEEEKAKTKIYRPKGKNWY